MKWRYENVPDLSGKTILITGANSGTGFHTARGVAAHGATTILACRNLQKGDAALAAIKAESPAATMELMQLNLADLSSVRAFAASFKEKYDQLNVLVNNAGVMALPYQKTADGFEMQFGTNHLGHFALTGLLLDVLLATPDARVATMSSAFHRRGVMNFDDLNGEKSYKKWGAYAQSKLANLLFAYELQRKFGAAGADAISGGAHPGYAATNLQTAGATSAMQRFGNKIMNALLAQSAEMGALPLLYAATAEDVRGGEYFGPGGFMNMRGYPQREESNDRSHNAEDAARLWQVSEELTGVQYDFGA